MFAAAKHQVFEQVRKARLSALFVLRSDVIPEVDGYDGRFVIFMNNQLQTVVEREGLMGNIRA